MFIAVCFSRGVGISKATVEKYHLFRSASFSEGALLVLNNSLLEWTPILVIEKFSVFRFPFSVFFITLCYETIDCTFEAWVTEIA